MKKHTSEKFRRKELGLNKQSKIIDRRITSFKETKRECQLAENLVKKIEPTKRNLTNQTTETTPYQPKRKTKQNQ